MALPSPRCAELQVPLAGLARVRAHPWPLLAELHTLLEAHAPGGALDPCDCTPQFTRLLARELTRLTPAQRVLLHLLLARPRPHSPFPSTLPVLAAALSDVLHPSLRHLRHLTREVCASPAELVVAARDGSFLAASLAAAPETLAADELVVSVLPAGLVDALSPALDLRLRTSPALLAQLSPPARTTLAQTLLRTAHTATAASSLAAALAARVAAGGLR